MRNIAIMNLKGGTGKTVTTINLAHILTAQYGKRVIVVDCDGQCNLTRFYGIVGPEDTTVADLLAGLSEAYWGENLVCVSEALQLLPASSTLYSLDAAAMTAAKPSSQRLLALWDFFEAVAEDDGADVVLFDCPPGFTAASCAALLAADEVIIPTLLDGFSLEGVVELDAQIQSLRRVSPDIRVAGVLINQWHRAPVVEQGEALLRDRGIPVFETVIRRTDKVPESTFMREAVLDYSSTSAASRDFRSLAAELFGEAGEARKDG